MCKTYALSILSGQMKLTKSDDTFQHTIAHLLHLVCDNSIQIKSRIKFLTLVYEILHRNPHVEIFEYDKKNLIWLLSLRHNSLPFKILVVITIWTLCRHKVPFDDADKATLCDTLHHDFISLKASGKIQAVNHILILMWLLSYDEFIQKHILSSKYIQTFTGIFTDLTKDDTREPDDLLNKRVVEHFPSELEG